MERKYDKILFVILAILGGLIILAACSATERDFEPELVAYPDIAMEEFSPKSGRPGEAITITGTNFW